MPEERNRKISIQLASQCAPTFLRVKPSSLMMLCPEDTEVLEVQTRKAGVSRCLLYRGNQRDMWLLYREEELNEILKKRKSAGFFRQWAILLFLFLQFSITSGCVFWSIRRTRGIPSRAGNPVGLSAGGCAGIHQEQREKLPLFRVLESIRRRGESNTAFPKL